MDDPRRAEARRLRTDPGLSRPELMRHFGVGNSTLTEWLRGVPTPEWTRRPRAKDDVREQAVRLRRHGSTVPSIAAELGVSTSTAYRWTRDLPIETPAQAAARRSLHSKRVAEARWEPLRQARDAERASVTDASAGWVGDLSDREVRLLGAAAYWCEGQKAKPWEPNRCRVGFVNSDPALVLLFLRFLELMGEDRRRLEFRLSIHESADVDGAGRWWAAVIGVPAAIFARPTLKTHNPSTVRRNVGESYRGCLVIGVPRSRELYWRIEGTMRGIALANAGG